MTGNSKAGTDARGVVDEAALAVIAMIEAGEYDRWLARLHVAVDQRMRSTEWIRAVKR